MLPTTRIRDTSLYVEVIGRGRPLLLMQGGPGADHCSMLPFREIAEECTLVFYDPRCNGRSVGAPVTSMTWENLTADADALREHPGFERWAVLGQSFGGHVALEYALRYPERVSHLALLDTGGEARWAQQHAPDVLARRGYSPATVRLARRFFSGRIALNEMMRGMMRCGGAYFHRPSPRLLVRELIAGRATRTRPEALIFAGRELLPGWSVMDRLAKIRAATLVIAGRDDFIFPPGHQVELAAGIPGSRLEIVERAGHNAPSGRAPDVMAAVREFVREPSARPGRGAGLEEVGAVHPTGLVRNHAIDEIPASHRDLVEFPPVAALTMLQGTVTRRHRSSGATLTASASGSTRCVASPRNGTCAAIPGRRSSVTTRGNRSATSRCGASSSR